MHAQGIHCKYVHLVDLVVKNSNQERWYGWAGLLMRRDKEAAWLLEQCYYAADKQATPAVFTQYTSTTKAAPLNKPISRYSTEVGLSYTTKSNYRCNNYLAYVSCLKIHCLKETCWPQSDRGISLPCGNTQIKEQPQGSLTPTKMT